MFQSRKQDYFNWKLMEVLLKLAAMIIVFQSRKQDYFNWKFFLKVGDQAITFGFSPASRIILIESKRSFFCCLGLLRFSPASRIILIESLTIQAHGSLGLKFQSRKQDYFNWKFFRWQV